jgi:hypothetical protein
LAVTIEAFKQRFPQFAKTDLGLIAACLAEAEGIVNRTAWGSRADAGVMNYAAHLVSQNPLGESARMKKRDDGRTVYLDTYDRLRKFAFRGPRVI